MKVTHEKFKQVVSRFITENIIPKINLQTEEAKAVARFVIGSYAESKYPELVENLRQFVLVCDDNEVDIDKTENAIMAGFKAAGGPVTMEKANIRFTFRQDDWMMLKRMI